MRRNCSRCLSLGPEEHIGDPILSQPASTLAELFPLPKGQRLFYWFDFGDDWKFSIGRTRTAPQTPEKGNRYPRLIGTRGDTPVQYPPCE